MGNQFTRRDFLSVSVAPPFAMGAVSAAKSRPMDANPGKGTWVRWLDGAAAPLPQGVTWGTPWPRGKQRDFRHLALRSGDQRILPLQSWPLAYWPDGSLKWTAHALPPSDAGN